MKKQMRNMALAFGTILLAGSMASAAMLSAKQEYSEKLDTFNIKDGKELHLTVGIGSGAYHLPGDPEDIIYTITDRGPNFDIAASEDIMGVKIGSQKGKIFPTPNFSPAIYKLSITGNGVSVLEKIQLKTHNGVPVSGISNAGTEPAFDINGKELPYDPSGVDAEGMVRLHDGSFWIGEEYGPSILHIAADGRIVERWVPTGVKASLEGAGYKVKELLPAILRQRPLNRGIESMSVSPDEKYLYFSMQSPLANPDKAAYQQSRNLRLFKIDRAAGAVVGEYVYSIDTPETFVQDNANKARKQNDVKVSEMTAIDTDVLVVLERISGTTKFYRVDLKDADNILGSTWDESATTPSLEQTASLPVKSLNKKLLMNSDEQDGLMKKIEGMAWLGGDRWLMVNDNDFGIEGDSTQIVPVKMSVK